MNIFNKNDLPVSTEKGRSPKKLITNCYGFGNRLITFALVAGRSIISIFSDRLANAGSNSGELLLFLLSLFLLEFLAFLSLHLVFLHLFLFESQPLLLAQFSLFFLFLLQFQPFLLAQFSMFFLLLLQFQPLLLTLFSFPFLLRFIFLSLCHDVFLCYLEGIIQPLL